jgi:hypothetical protein
MTSSPRHRRGPELLGLLLIAIGGLFLLRTLGILTLDLGSLWPLILIAIGVVVVAGAFGGSASPRSVAVPRDGVARLEIRLRIGAGRFRLGAASAPEALVQVDSTDDDVALNVRRDGSLARISLNRDPGWWLGGWSRGGGEWQIGIARDCATRLDVSGGAGDFVLDLFPLRIVGGTISAGAASVRVRLPKPVGDVPLTVSAGAAGITIEVPAGVDARVTTRGLLSVSGRTETPGYAAATDRVSVRVEGGAASVTVV